MVILHFLIFDGLEIGCRGPRLFEHPDAIKTYLVRWNGVNLDLTKLAKLRWIEKRSIPDLCQAFGKRRTAICRSIRTLRMGGISELNLTLEEGKLILTQMMLEAKINGGRYNERPRNSR